MSLVDFISYRAFQDLRDKFKEVFPRPAIKLTGELLAPPLTANYSVVGQAFDYLLRFTLEHRNKEKINSSGGWVADLSYSRIIKQFENSSTKIIRVGRLRDTEKNRRDFLQMLKSEFTNAKANYQIFLSNGVLTDSIIKSALYLARLDITVRAGFVDTNLGNESDLDIQDVRQILSLINEEHFKVENHCVLNPTFGNGSGLVGGADGDLIIDDTLIDLKVTKNLTVERKHLNQAIGYYILSLIGGINTDEDFKPIKQIGIYFARHGILWKMPLSEIASEESILEFKNWFYKYADDKIWGRQFEELKKRVAKKPVKKLKKKARKKAVLRKKKTAGNKKSTRQKSR